MADTQVKERPRLKVRYDNEVRGQLKESLGLTNIMQVPRLEKIVVNMGVGRATQQASLLDGAVTDLTLITGQKPLGPKPPPPIPASTLRAACPTGPTPPSRAARRW